MSALHGFHPAVRRWFAAQFAEPTPAQRRGWQAIRSGRHTLIAAPTGSGKTLAAFLHALDTLLRDGCAGALRDEVRVVYVSPLKALSHDIHRNLAEPRRGIREALHALGGPDVAIRAAVRTGDTPSAERQAMTRRPPHILVTTPESLYLLLTSDGGRRMLRTARTVIVDEIHAVADNRRGAHLALSLERLEHLTGGGLQRIGLSATQRPIDEVARFLVGRRGLDAHGRPDCTIVDEGHRRALDVAIEVPRSPLEAVMSAEVWEEVYDRIAELVAAHRTTLVFVNTRRLAERVTRHLSDRLGADAVTSHHGSLAREVRHRAEARLREGSLKALVATASLELGIDVGAVDLVIQIGSPRRISTWLQRVGRAGHTVHGTPKGRLFPLTRDELVECAALLRAVRRGALEPLLVPDAPLDVLAQQIVAEASCEDWAEDALYALYTNAYPYRNLPRETFDEVVRMLADGFTTRRGRRGALLHHDGVNRRIRGRRGAWLTALTSGGAIPDTADFGVVVEPAGTLVGTLNEDFAIESLPGDIFQLGNASWRILRVESGTVRVEDAQGQPPTIPFWLGEAPGRSDALSAEVSALREELDARLDDPESAIAWCTEETGSSRAAAAQIVEYLADAKRTLGALPTQRRLVLERFFDDAGGMQLVLHAPFGSRVNRAWGLALRKTFCRTFNFELQAAATEDGLVLSLGPQHSFPLDDVFRYLRPKTVRDVLVQAMLDAPVFGTRWRWNVTRALAVPRSRGGARVPPQILRMQADDLLAAVFPDAAACFENLPGGVREVPDHPLVRQTIEDVLHEAMDLDGLVRVLEAIEAGAVECVARDVPEPSPLCHEILNAKPYAFLDDAPLEERRTQAVYTRRVLEASSVAELGTLDPAAVARVREEAWPDPQNADELHDALCLAGCLTEAEGDAGRAGVSWRPWFDELLAAGRAGRFRADGAPPLWVAAERWALVRAVHPAGRGAPACTPPPREAAVAWTREAALRELVRGRLEVSGPTTAPEIAARLGASADEVAGALLALESEGFVLRGRFTSGPTAAGSDATEWCERRWLARIHRYTLHRLRAEIEPVSTADFLRFLFAWQRADPEHRVAGPEGLAAVLEMLDGYECAAAAWESDVLPARLAEYDPLWLDGLCLAGRVAWARISPPARAAGDGADAAAPGPVRSTPIAFFLREHADVWLARAPAPPPPLRPETQRVLDVLRERGASFFPELVAATGALPTQVENALAELVALGLVASDSFAGLRALLIPSERRRRLPNARRRRHPGAPFGVESAGRWSVVRRPEGAPDPEAHERALEVQARTLLRRYGVVCRRLLAHEPNAAPWGELGRVYRRLEAQGEIRGGRFVAGVAGEQFALPEAVALLRKVRKQAPAGTLLSVSAADPLNLVGILTPGDRVPALRGNRILYRDGVPVAVREGGRTRPLAPTDPSAWREWEAALLRRPAPPLLRVYLGRTG